MTCLIVARYSEDISWLKNYKNFDIIIYNKGKPFQENLDFTIKEITNVGRESHTWLFHIIKNYNKDNIKINEVIETVKQSGGLDYAKEKMLYFHDKALKILRTFEKNESRISLELLLDYVINRKK